MSHPHIGKRARLNFPEVKDGLGGIASPEEVVEGQLVFAGTDGCPQLGLRSMATIMLDDGTHRSGHIDVLEIKQAELEAERLAIELSTQCLQLNRGPRMAAVPSITGRDALPGWPEDLSAGYGGATYELMNALMRHRQMFLTQSLGETKHDRARLLSVTWTLVEQNLGRVREINGQDSP